MNPEKNFKETRWKTSTVTTLEDELKRKISGFAECTNLVQENATVTEGCAERLIADTVVAGVTI